MIFRNADRVEAFGELNVTRDLGERTRFGNASASFTLWPSPHRRAPCAKWGKRRLSSVRILAKNVANDSNQLAPGEDELTCLHFPRGLRECEAPPANGSGRLPEGCAGLVQESRN